VAASPENVVDRGGEIVQPRARDDDGVPPAMRFLGDSQESSALILAKFEMKSLPFDLNFSRFENAVHLKTHRSLSNSFVELEANSAGLRRRKLFDGSGF
jgi:hypothetical protein